jgi:small subunit ribosomal protein S20
LAKRTLSGQKQARKSNKRRLVNRDRKLELRTALKNIAAAKSKAEAEKQLTELQSLIDRVARRRIIHAKTASRLKSRVAREAAMLK